MFWHFFDHQQRISPLNFPNFPTAHPYKVNTGTAFVGLQRSQSSIYFTPFIAPVASMLPGPGSWEALRGFDENNYFYMDQPDGTYEFADLDFSFGLEQPGDPRDNHDGQHFDRAWYQPGGPQGFGDAHKPAGWVDESPSTY